MFAKGTSRFGGIWKECLGLVVLSSGLSAVREYCSSSLTLVFRHKLTKHIQDLYFQDMNYYHIANAPGRKCACAAQPSPAQPSPPRRCLCGLHGVPLSALLASARGAARMRPSFVRLFAHAWGAAFGAY